MVVVVVVVVVVIVGVVVVVVVAVVLKIVVVIQRSPGCALTLESRLPSGVELWIKDSQFMAESPSLHASYDGMYNADCLLAMIIIMRRVQESRSHA